LEVPVVDIPMARNRLPDHSTSRNWLPLTLFWAGAATHGAAGVGLGEAEGEAVGEAEAEAEAVGKADGDAAGEPLGAGVGAPDGAGDPLGAGETTAAGEAEAEGAGTAAALGAGVVVDDPHPLASRRTASQPAEARPTTFRAMTAPLNGWPRSGAGRWAPFSRVWRRSFTSDCHIATSHVRLAPPDVLAFSRLTAERSNRRI
jgi:hypothetical protein